MHDLGFRPEIVGYIAYLKENKPNYCGESARSAAKPGSFIRYMTYICYTIGHTRSDLNPSFQVQGIVLFRFIPTLINMLTYPNRGLSFSLRPSYIRVEA